MATHKDTDKVAKMLPRDLSCPHFPQQNLGTKGKKKEEKE